MSTTLLNIFISAICGGITSFFLYLAEKKNVRKQILFEMGFTNLFSEVYLPLIKEYKTFIESENTKNAIDIGLIESILVNNQARILFTPKKIKNILDILYSLIKPTNTIKAYENREDKIVQQLKELQIEVTEYFKEFVYE